MYYSPCHVKRKQIGIHVNILRRKNMDIHDNKYYFVQFKTSVLRDYYKPESVLVGKKHFGVSAQLAVSWNGTFTTSRSTAGRNDSHGSYCSFCSFYEFCFRIQIFFVFKFVFVWDKVRAGLAQHPLELLICIPLQRNARLPHHQDWIHALPGTTLAWNFVVHSEICSSNRLHHLNRILKFSEGSRARLLSGTLALSNYCNCNFLRLKQTWITRGLRCWTESPTPTTADETSAVLENLPAKRCGVNNVFFSLSPLKTTLLSHLPLEMALLSHP